MPTWGELSNFTHGELSKFTYEELKLSINELKQLVREQNRELPIETYEKICNLCTEISETTGKEIKSPKKDIFSALNKISLIIKLSIDIPEFIDKYGPIIKKLLNSLRESLIS